MHVVFSILLPALTIFYVGLILRFAFGLQRVLEASADVEAKHEVPFVTVVVAARNEEVTIGTCLERISANDYPEYEVIVVDDFSRDATADRVNAFAARFPEGRIRLIRLSDHVDRNDTGKAGAIAVGIDEARGSVILTTDADCLVGRQWIRSMMMEMRPGVDFVSGPVLFDPGEKWHGRLQALEFLGLIAIGAGGIGSALPNMCNSANIAYRREVYHRMSGHLPTNGAPPDEVMLQLLHRKDPGSVTFCSAREAAVRTAPATGMREFVGQRRRWAGNGARYPSRRLMAAIVGLYAFYVVLLAALIAMPFNKSLLIVVPAVLALKIVAEASVIVPAARHFGQTRLLRWLIPGQLLQIPYVVVIGLAGVIGEVDWKDRSAH